MKKNEKIVFIVNTLAAAVKTLSNEFERTYREETKKDVFIYDEDNMGISNLPDNEWEQLSGFIVLYDKDNKRIGGNHLCNEKITYANYKHKFGIIAREEEANYFSLCHYLWKEENAYKVRYAELTLENERGDIKWKISIDIFKGKIIVE